LGNPDVAKVGQHPCFAVLDVKPLPALLAAHPNILKDFPNCGVVLPGCRYCLLVSKLLFEFGRTDYIGEYERQDRDPMCTGTLEPYRGVRSRSVVSPMLPRTPKYKSCQR
jgi:hypothetical protein